jgi:hypothetical protein
VVWTGLIWLRIGTSGGSFEHGNETTGYMKCWKILGKSKLWFRKKVSAPWSQYVEHIALNDDMTNE